MNKQRRGILAEMETSLSALSEQLESVIDAEQEALDNIPENLQYSERYEQMESGLESIQSAFDSIGEALSYIQEVIDV